MQINFTLPSGTNIQSICIILCVIFQQKKKYDHIIKLKIRKNPLKIHLKPKKIIYSIKRINLIFKTMIIFICQINEFVLLHFLPHIKLNIKKKKYQKIYNTFTFIDLILLLLSLLVNVNWDVWMFWYPIEMVRGAAAIQPRDL